MASTEAEKKAQKKYREKTITLSCNYTQVDYEDGKKIKEYLELTGQKTNSYLKRLIKEDLEKNGFF